MCCGKGKSKAKKPTEVAQEIRAKKKVDGFSSSKKSFQNGKRK